jgi:hypothetical protein
MTPPSHPPVQPAAPPEPGSRMARALAALDVSRAALRLAMLPPEPDCDGDAHGHSGGGSGPGRRWPRAWCRLRRWVRRQPMAQLMADGAQAWWQQHPLHPVADLLAREWRGALLPAVRRHPVATVLAAAAGAATLVASRPWRWPAVRGELRPLPRRAGHWLMAQLGSAPVQAMIAGWLALTVAKAAPAPARPVAPQAAAAAAAAAAAE